MLLNKNKILAVSLTVLSVLCTACNNTTNQSTDTDSFDNNVAVDNTHLPDVNDDMAPDDEDKIEIKIGLVKNSASALGAVHLFVNSENNSAYEKYTPVVYNSNDELYNAFNNGEIGVAVLPPDKAALAYNNVNCYVTAVTGGSNYYIAENGGTINDITDINGKTITISNEDTMAETVLNIIGAYNNISINYNKVESNADLVAGLKNGTVSLALTQEPYLSQVTGNNVRSAVDLYDFWNDAVGEELVTSCLIMNKNFVSEQPVAFQFFMKDYSASASIAKRNTEETSNSASKFALIDDSSSSKAAIPGCGVTFKTNEEMKKMLTAFYNAVINNNPDILGGNVPDDDFYFIEK